MASAPPPLKRRRRDEPEQPALGALALDLSGIEDDDQAAQPTDDDATEGEWLFKQDDVVLGPVSAAVLVPRIEAGELSADTPVGREAGKWRPLKAVPYFKEILDKAEAQKRALLEQLEREARLRRQRLARWSALAGLFVVPFLLGAVAGRAVWIAKPWDRGDEWLQRPPPLVDLPPKPKAEPPPEENRVVEARDDDEEKGEGEEDEERVADAEEQDAKDAPTGKKSAGKRTAKKATTSSKKTASRTQQKKADAPKVAKADEKKDSESGGAPLQTLTQKQVMAPVLKSQGAIGNCLKAEVARNPDIPSRVTLMWTVTEAGRATGFRLKEREVREGPLAGCLGKLFDGMRWPRFTGERKNVELPLGVKK